MMMRNTITEPEFLKSYYLNLNITLNNFTDLKQKFLKNSKYHVAILNSNKNKNIK